MKVRLMTMAVVCLAAACGGGLGSTPWDKNRDGLVGPCEGLDRPACEAASSCRVEPLACIALCVDDGLGGCRSACDEDFTCVPVPVDLPCEQLSLDQCVADARCIADVGACTAVCRPDGQGGCLPCDPVFTCRTRPVADCGSLAVDACSVRPDCELQTLTVCEGDVEPADAGTAGGPDGGAGGSGGGDPDHGGSGGSGGSGSDEPLDGGVAPPVPPCNGGCSAVLVCAPKATDSCGNRSVDSCEADARCELITWACPAICEDDGHGGCKPCAAPPIQCVERAEPVPAPAPGPR